MKLFLIRMIHITFVYEDEALGLLYFYDEELVDVDEEDENGNVQTVTKKKIIQKQVKATKGYRQLAKYRNKMEYTNRRSCYKERICLQAIMKRVTR